MLEGDGKKRPPRNRAHCAEHYRALHTIVGEARQLVSVKLKIAFIADKVKLS